jgi:phosphopantothenoylcysteine decarboxylase / phosphopantothenate---cysteine ligase
VRPFAQRRVLLGVTGGIACYKSVALARALTQAGAEVDVVQTRASQDFVGPVTFEAVTGRPVSTHLIAAGHALDHIKLARAAHAIVVAPATADFLARAAIGRADDLLTAILLAADAPILLVPAMNDRMWSHPQTTQNVVHLRSLGYRVLDPETGPLAVGEGSGPGRMPEPETILAHIGRLLDADGVLRGRRIVVTAGSTREPIDPVRFISNRSSGKMGVAIAAAAWRRGADVTLIAGPLAIAPPVGLSVIDVETAAEMRDAVAAHLRDADVLIMAAAPADFRPATVAEQKIKKTAAPSALALEPTDDILLATQDFRSPAAIIVGFALETEAAVAGGRDKLKRKSLDLVVVNDATEAGAGFGVDTNRVTFVFGNGTPDEALPLLAKSDVADAILDRVEGLLRAR